MASDEHRGQRIAVGVLAIVDDGERFDAGDVELLELAEHVILALGEIKKRLLDRNHMLAEVGKSHRVARESFGQSRDVLYRPVLQWQMPRQIQQSWFCRGSRNG